MHSIPIAHLTVFHRTTFLISGLNFQSRVFLWKTLSPWGQHWVAGPFIIFQFKCINWMMRLFPISIYFIHIVLKIILAKSIVGWWRWVILSVNDFHIQLFWHEYLLQNTVKKVHWTYLVIYLGWLKICI